MGQETKVSENKIENIPIKDLVDRRCNGSSFDELADVYGVSKMGVYIHYMKAKERDYDGYEPYDLEFIKENVKSGRKTVPQLAEALGIPYKGLRMYMMDRGIARIPNKRKIRAYLSRGRTIGWLATFYGMSRGKFTKWLKDNCPDLFEKSMEKGDD